MKTLISILLIGAVLAWGGYYVARDIPLFAKVLPQSLIIEADDPLHLLYIERLDRIRSEHRRIATPVLPGHYIELANNKYEAMLPLIDKFGILSEQFGTSPEQFGISSERYLQIKQGEHEKCLAFYTDANKNSNDQLSLKKFSGSQRAQSQKMFKKVDSDGNGLLSKREYFKTFGGEKKALRFARSADSDGNGIVSAVELRNFKLYTANSCWQP